MEQSPPLSVLFLCDLRANNANAIDDHITAFTAGSRHYIFPFDPLFMPGSYFLDLNEFDVVAIHYSVFVLSEVYLSRRFKERIKAFPGLKVQFIQDDYRQINAMSAAMRELGIHVLYTLCPEKVIPKVWSEERLPGVLKLNTLAGYVPEHFKNLRPPRIAERPIDVGYRGRTVPFWLGELGQDKIRICRRFLEHGPSSGLRYDVSSREEDRIYGDNWALFLESCKAVLGTESGASITDYDGSVEKNVRDHLADRPNATFEEVQQALLLPYENNAPMNVISPRVFEAAAHGAALVLYPGDYSGILRPWVHYIPLEKDFSNFEQVVRKIKDVPFLDDMTARAQHDLVRSELYSYRTFISGFDEVLAERGSKRNAAHKNKYRLALLEKKFSNHLAYVKGILGRLGRRCKQSVIRTYRLRRGPQLVANLAVQAMVHAALTPKEGLQIMDNAGYRTAEFAASNQHESE